MSIKVKHKETKDSFHIPGDGTYATLCGLDGNDSKVDQLGCEFSEKKINCQACYRIWLTSTSYSARDFTKEARG